MEVGKSEYDAHLYLNMSETISVSSVDHKHSARLRLTKNGFQLLTEADYRKEFDDYLEEASAIVDSWPEWKRRAAGGLFG